MRQARGLPPPQWAAAGPLLNGEAIGVRELNASTRSLHSSCCCLTLEHSFDYCQVMVLATDHDASRCTARSSRGRCQLFRGHDGTRPRGHDLHGDRVYSRGTGRTRPKQVIRWGADNGEWIDPGEKWGAAATGKPPWHSTGAEE
jgi:hypothetical protein